MNETVKFEEIFANQQSDLCVFLFGTSGALLQGTMVLKHVGVCADNMKSFQKIGGYHIVRCENSDKSLKICIYERCQNGDYNLINHFDGQKWEFPLKQEKELKTARVYLERAKSFFTVPKQILLGGA